MPDSEKIIRLDCMNIGLSEAEGVTQAAMILIITPFVFRAGDWNPPCEARLCSTIE